MSQYRHELKYLCSDNELQIISSRLNPLMERDIHALDGKYLIRSIYFDDFFNSSVLSNEEGVSPRKKWRIRAYNHDSSLIMLECKSKAHGMISKDSCQLSAEQYKMLLDGKGSLSDCNAPLLNRFIFEQNTSILKPAVIVQYTRVPFVYPMGNVRITFDLNISSSDDIDGFFADNLPARPILETGRQLLEVKYDEYIPDHVYHAVQLVNMQQITFSKYYLCRKFSRGTYTI